MLMWLQNFLDNVLSNDLDNLILLKCLMGDVEGQIFGVNDSYAKVEIFRDELFTVVHDEAMSDVQLDVISVLFFKQVQGSPLQNKDNSFPCRFTHTDSS